MSNQLVSEAEVKEAISVLDDAAWKTEIMAEKRRLKSRANTIWLALMKRAPAGNKDFKQAWVEVQPEYEEACRLLGEADASEFAIRGKMDAARLTVEVWRSQESTHRELNRTPR